MWSHGASLIADRDNPPRQVHDDFGIYEDIVAEEEPDSDATPVTRKQRILIFQPLSTTVSMKHFYKFKDIDVRTCSLRSVRTVTARRRR